MMSTTAIIISTLLLSLLNLVCASSSSSPPTSEIVNSGGGIPKINIIPPVEIYTSTNRNGKQNTLFLPKSFIESNDKSHNVHESILPSSPLSFQHLNIRGGHSNSSTSISISGRPRKNYKIKKETKEEKVHTNEYNNDIGDDNNTHDDNNNLPIVEAILIPRKISIPQSIRLVSTILFISSFIECLRTSGNPFTNAVVETLLSHSIKPQFYNQKHDDDEQHHHSISSFDIYMAKKIASSSSSISLPPTFLPNVLPFLGLMLALFIYIGISILFPMWFIQFETWMDYIKLNIDSVGNDDNIDDHHDQFVISNEQKHELQYYLNTRNEERIVETDPTFYQSQFVNRKHLPSKEDSYTGLAVLLHLSKYDQEMGEETGKSYIIQKLYYEDNDDDTTTTTTSALKSYFIELNQRRIYIDIDIDEVHKDEKKNSYETFYKVAIKCRDGSPTFYKTESLQQLQSRINTGIIAVNNDTSSTLLRVLKEEDPISKLKKYQNRYLQYNQLELPVPTIQKAFISRISKPLSIMQFVGKFLSIFEDDSLAPSILNIASTMGRHYWSAMRSIVSAQELASEVQGNVKKGVDEQTYWTLRPTKVSRKISKKKKKKMTSAKSSSHNESIAEEVIRNRWRLIPSSQLLPGDVFCFPPQREATGKKQKVDKEGQVMPVDALLLEGNCVALEAIITGESVPQAKIASRVDDPSERLCMDTTHRSSSLFAGTTIMQSTNDFYCGHKKVGNRLPKKVSKSFPSHLQPIKCLALRTGSYSTKGEIVRALSKSKRHSGGVTTPASERDSVKLIAILATFAMIACATLFMPFSQTNRDSERTVTAFRRVIQCSRIAIASIPSDLPLTLSHVAQSCCIKLRNDADVVCSEPGALLSASQTNMVVFDKTGTLTSDTQSLKKVVPCYSSDNINGIIHPMSNVVLASCHSLISLGKNGQSKTNTFAGDPLDIAALDYSKWDYNDSFKCASTKINDDPSGPKKVWQIKTFPFDASRRRSSALVLVLVQGKLRLWQVIKGSPDSMASFIKFPAKKDKKKYLETIQELGLQGLRVITLAAKDVSDDMSMVNTLFSNGLPKWSERNEVELKKLIQKARNAAQGKISIDDIEKDTSGSYGHVGFACFDTVIRPSTNRIVRDLRASGTHVLMLTGDAPEAAFAVATSAGFYDNKASKTNYLLDVNNDNELSLRLSKKKHQQSHLLSVQFCFQTVEKIIDEATRDKCTIGLTGKAFDYILKATSSEKIDDKYIACLKLLLNLNVISVISRSSPNTKQRVVSTLKTMSTANVMMCGDGVNDLAAMKTADVSAALLTGYGHETAGTIAIDAENERRKSKLRQKQEGGNFHRSKSHLTREQQQALKKGGAAAARILADENALPQPNDQHKELEVESDEMQIKAGEASLASQFTFLRPCVDGAESILRSGIAAAAFSLSCHRSIALNSLMACCNLATLYRHGFRYGKYMWNVELSLMMALDQAQHEVSCTPRPRVSPIRPHQSIFHPSSALSILLQSLCHLYILSFGHYGATIIEKKYGNSFEKGVTVRLLHPEMFGPLGQLFKTNLISKDEKRTIFGKKVFKPNHITNVVFILSCFQNTMITLVNHIGAPYSGSILESRSFCLWTGLSILFCVATATEAFKPLNEFLELAPMPSKLSKIFLLALIAFDGVISIVVDKLCVYLFDNERWKLMTNPKRVRTTKDHAADEEDLWLANERKANQSLSFLFGLGIIFLLIQHVVV